MTENKSAGGKEASAKAEPRSHASTKGKRSRDTRSIGTGTGFMAASKEYIAKKIEAQQLDPDDAPELTEEFFKRADIYQGDKLVRAGRPPSENPKLALKLRIDPDVVEYFRATGPGWQTRINDTLRRAAKLPPRKYE